MFDLEGWTHHSSAADPRTIVALASFAGDDLPRAYLDLLRISNGGGGPLGARPGWFELWPAEDVPARNRAYEIDRHVPGLLGFGSDGGGELLAFDTRRGPPWPVVMAPFIGMEEATVVEIAEDFEEFLRSTGRDCSGG